MDVGQLTLIGPFPSWQDATCVEALVQPTRGAGRGSPGPLIVRQGTQSSHRDVSNILLLADSDHLLFFPWPYPVKRNRACPLNAPPLEVRVAVQRGNVQRAQVSGQRCVGELRGVGLSAVLDSDDTLVVMDTCGFDGQRRQMQLQRTPQVPCLVKRTFFSVVFTLIFCISGNSIT